MHSQLGHSGEGFFAVVHVHLRDIQEGLLLVLASEGRLSSYEHVGDYTNTPEIHTHIKKIKEKIGRAHV